MAVRMTHMPKKINVRTKGHAFEREVAKALKPIFPLARRQLEYHENDCLGVDIANTGPYRIQCKRYKAYAPISKIEEVKADELMGEVPILVTKADRGPVLAVLPFDELLRLIRFWNKI